MRDQLEDFLLRATSDDPREVLLTFNINFFVISLLTLQSVSDLVFYGVERRVGRAAA